MRINVSNQSYNDRFKQKLFQKQTQEDISFKQILPVNKLETELEKLGDGFKDVFTMQCNEKLKNVLSEGRDAFIATDGISMHIPTFTSPENKKILDLGGIVNVKTELISMPNAIDLNDFQLGQVFVGWIQKHINDKFVDNLRKLERIVKLREDIMQQLLKGSQEKNSTYPGQKVYQCKFPNWGINTDGFSKLTTQEACESFLKVINSSPEKFSLDGNGNVYITIIPEKASNL